MRPVPLAAVILLFLVAGGHLVRLLLRIEVTAGATRIPMWASVLGCVVPAVVAILLLREEAKRP